MSDLKGKVAVVTGASKGIGAAIAKGLSAAGAAVVVNIPPARRARTVLSPTSKRTAVRPLPSRATSPRPPTCSGCLTKPKKPSARSTCW
jgi:NAD(P)-dependent dehydrogenase (short-subunit alcohol dehydrogenase family)